MTIPRSPQVHALTLAAALLALTPACGRSPTKPGATTEPAVHRTVTMALRDSLGSPVAHASVTWAAQFDSGGTFEMLLDETGTDGTCAQVLREGNWQVLADDGTRVSAGDLAVAGAARAAADTQLVRLVLHTPSSASGSVHLGGRTDFSGTLVSLDNGSFAFTDSTGAWRLEHVPLGNWHLLAYRPGFQLASVPLVVTLPGSALAVSTILLAPAH